MLHENGTVMLDEEEEERVFKERQNMNREQSSRAGRTISGKNLGIYVVASDCCFLYILSHM